MRKPGEGISEATADSALAILGLKNEIVRLSFAHTSVSKRFQALQKNLPNAVFLHGIQHVFLNFVLSGGVGVI